MRNSSAAAERSRARSWRGGGAVGSGVKSHQPPSGHQIHLDAPGLRDQVTHRGNTSLQEQWNENKGRWCRGRSGHRKAEPRAPRQGRADGTAAVTSAPRLSHPHRGDSAAIRKQSPRLREGAPPRSAVAAQQRSPGRAAVGGRERTVPHPDGSFRRNKHHEKEWSWLG